MKQGRLTPTIVVLVLSLLVGFSLLALAYKPSMILVLALASVLVVLSVLLIRYAVIFDRQIREKLDEKETTQ